MAAARGAGRTGRRTAAPTGRARRRAPGAPDDALTAPVGPALRGGVLAELDRAAPERPTRDVRARRRGRSARARGIRRLLRRLPRRRVVVLRVLAAAVGVAALAPVVAFVLGYAFFSVPTPDDAVNNQVALISYADGSQLTRLVPEQGNRMVVPVEQVPPARAARPCSPPRTARSTPTRAST